MHPAQLDSHCMNADQVVLVHHQSVSGRGDGRLIYVKSRFQKAHKSDLS
jgi:hypothetical protein